METLSTLLTTSSLIAAFLFTYSAFKCSNKKRWLGYAIAGILTIALSLIIQLQEQGDDSTHETECLEITLKTNKK